MNARINSNSEIRIIQSRVNSEGLYLFRNSNKARKVEHVPSNEEVSVEYNKVLVENPIPKYPLSKKEKFVMSGSAQFEYRRRVIISERKCRAQFFSNSIIRSYLLRNDVIVNEFGIPEYSEAERQICFFPKVPYIACRNPDKERAFDDWVFLEEKNKDTLAYQALKRIIEGNEQLKNNEQLTAMLTYNFLSVGVEGNIVLIKNKKRFNSYKIENPSVLNGIHYVDRQMDVRDISHFIAKIKSNEIELDDRDRNVWILAIYYDGHITGGALVVDKSDLLSIELVMLDSSENNGEGKYGSDFMRFVNRSWPANAIKFTYIPYGAQPNNDGIHEYHSDANCFFYSVYTMNALVRILGSSEGGSLQRRLLNRRATEEVDSEEDIEGYIQELRRELLVYFDFDEASGVSTVKPFDKRQCVNIANRWRLGRDDFKRYFEEFSTA